MKILKIIGKVVYYAFLTAIAALAIMLLLSVLPFGGNIKFLTVLSGSMEPAIKTGSVVLIKPADNYQVGDIITFGKISKTQVPTTHRIVEIREEGGRITYLTKGDANEEADTKEVARGEILGKVLFDAPWVGYAVAAAQKPAGFMLIIVVPAAIIIGDEIRKIVREVKKIRKSKIADNSTQ